MKLIKNTEFGGERPLFATHDLRLENVTLHGGTYPFMFSENIFVDGLNSDSKYVFQYCKNVEVHNARILTKDSFWECENVTIYDSDLDGEYLAWHSKNVRLVNCHLSKSLSVSSV